MLWIDHRVLHQITIDIVDPHGTHLGLVGDIKERPERGRRKQTITTCPEPANLLQLLGKLLQQHGFAYAGLARDEYQPALSLPASSAY